MGLTFPCRASILTGASAAGREEAKLNFYNWDTYIGETTLADFKAASGISVDLTTFASAAEMFSMLDGNRRYDLVVAGSEDLARLAQSDMLLPIDHEKVPNAKNIDRSLLEKSYDPQCLHSMPYMWYAVGVGYRKSKVDGVPDSWRWLFDSDAYSGRVAVMADMDMLFRCAFKYMGKSINAATPELIAQAEALLIRQKPHIRVFHEDNGQDILLWNEIDIVMEYNGDMAQAMTKDDDVAFVIPNEGSVRNCDCLVIPKGAPHPENAHAFIDFILDAQVGVKIIETIKYPSANAAAVALMPDDYKFNPTIFPPADALSRLEYSIYAGPEITRLMEEAMDRLRAA